MPEPAGRQVKRILIVDDHPIVRQGLKESIGNEPDLEVCGEAEGMSQALQAFRDTQPDLVIVDISLENGSGIELIKELVAGDPGVKTLVASIHEESLFSERVLRAGAKGYINKEESVARMLEAIRTVLDGRIFLSEDMTNRVLFRTVGSNEDSIQSPMDTLSDRELEVFEQIGHGVPTQQIAEKLHLSPKTVETYRENIKDKLELDNATELTQHAVRWVLERS